MRFSIIKFHLTTHSSSISSETSVNLCSSGSILDRSRVSILILNVDISLSMDSNINIVVIDIIINCISSSVLIMVLLGITRTAFFLLDQLLFRIDSGETIIWLSIWHKIWHCRQLNLMFTICVVCSLHSFKCSKSTGSSWFHVNGLTSSNFTIRVLLEIWMSCNNIFQFIDGFMVVSCRQSMSSMSLMFFINLLESLFHEFSLPFLIFFLVVMMHQTGSHNDNCDEQETNHSNHNPYGLGFFWHSFLLHCNIIVCCIHKFIVAFKTHVT
jgi:hypothetical protein